MTTSEQWHEYVFVVRDGEDLRNAFVIDSRDYADGTAFDSAREEAWAVMEPLGLWEVEHRFGTEPTGRLPLPTWEDYRAALQTE